MNNKSFVSFVFVALILSALVGCGATMNLESTVRRGGNVVARERYIRTANGSIEGRREVDLPPGSRGGQFGESGWGEFAAPGEGSTPGTWLMQGGYYPTAAERTLLQNQPDTVIVRRPVGQATPMQVQQPPPAAEDSSEIARLKRYAVANEKRAKRQEEDIRQLKEQQAEKKNESRKAAEGK